MIHFNSNDAATALVSATTPTFAELIERLAEDEALSPERRRDMTSGLRRVAEVLGRPVEAVPADPTWLQPRLFKVAPAAFAMTGKTWSNVQSNARAALAHFGCVGRRKHRMQELSPQWRELWEAVLASGNKTLGMSLGRFVYFLNAQGVEPEEVSDEHAVVYHAALTADEIRKSPQLVFRNGLLAWNQAVRTIDGWPDRPLAVPTTQKRIKLALDSFPEGFAAELAKFRTSLLKPDLLDPDALEVARSVSTADQYERELHRFASILVRAGVPIAEIDSLAALVMPARAEIGLRWMLDRANGKTSRSIDQIATLLKLVARRFVRVPEAGQKRLDRLAQRLVYKKPSGMTPKNRERLRQFQTPATLRRLLLLPEVLMARAESKAGRHKAALDRRDALMLAILLVVPLRRENLAGIHLEQNLQRPGDGSVYLVFPAEEVKNRQALEFELPAGVVAMIERYLATRAPYLCPADSPWLFSSRDGLKPMHLDSMTKRVGKVVHRELGLEINPHLFRHLSAKLLLDAYPGAYEAVRHLLGHARLSSTLNAYIGLEAAGAARLFAGVIEDARAAR